MTYTLPKQPAGYEVDAVMKYECLMPEEQAILDAQAARLRNHFVGKCYRGIPCDASLLGLVMQVGKYATENAREK